MKLMEDFHLIEKNDMKINKFNEQKLYTQNREFVQDLGKCLSKYSICIDITKKTIDLLKKLDIPFKVSRTIGYSNCSLDGKEFNFVYIGGFSFYIMETDDEWFYVKLTKGYKCDGYEGLTQLLTDWKNGIVIR